jgi:hypothetical protein
MLKVNDANFTEQLVVQFVEQLEKILSNYKPGNCPVYILYAQQKISVPIQLNNTWRAQLKDTLLQQLKDLLGEGNVIVNY